MSYMQMNDIHIHMHIKNELDQIALRIQDSLCRRKKVKNMFLQADIVYAKKKKLKDLL